MKKKVLVTGCSGFIGSALCKRLIHDGYEVFGIDRKPCSFLDGVHFNQLCLNSMNRWDIPSGVEIVFHLAGKTGVRKSNIDFKNYLWDNVLATKRLLDCLPTTDVKKFIYTSSSSVYGDRGHDAPFKEEDKTNPKSPYGMTKLMAENLIQYYMDIYDMDYVISRQHTCYGEGQRTDLAMHKFITNIKNNDINYIYTYNDHDGYDKEMRRDYIHIDDTVQSLIDFMKRGYGIYNVANRKSYDTLDVLFKIAKILGKKPLYEYEKSNPLWGEMRYTWGNIDRVEDEVMWHPRISLDEGLRKQIEWMKEKK